jgi:hypothetical protein
MSLIIRVKGADFSAAGLPQLKRRIDGMPADGLQGLYWFEADGTDESPTAGPFTDSSGNGNHAVMYGNYSSPIKKSFGLQDSGDGLGFAIDTGLTYTRSWTAIICGRHRGDPSVALPANSYPALLGHSLGVSSEKTGSSSNALFLTLNGSLLTTTVGAAQDSWGLFDSTGDFTGETRRPVDPKTYGGSSERVVIASRINGDTGQTSLRTHSGYSDDNVNPEVIGAYQNGWDTNQDNGGVPDSGLPGRLIIGSWRQGTDPNYPGGELYAAAFYDRALSETEMATAMSAMKSRLASRGLAMFGG